MSVLAVAARPPPIAGQSLATASLLEALDDAGVPHAVVDLSREFFTERPALQTARRALSVLRLPLELALQARALPSPIVYYHQLGQRTRAMARDLPLLALAAARRWPMVVHVHGGGFGRALAEAPRPLARALSALLANAEVAIVHSPSLRSMFDGVIAPERVVCVDNGTSRAHTEAARALERGPPGPMFRALYLSNLIDAKGYGTVLEAARRAAARELPLQFCVAGAPTEMGSIDPEAFIREHRLDNATFVGPVYGAIKRALLASADALVLPTAYPTEGQPIAVLEAMQFGLPVIATRQGGIADVITGPACGALIEPGDPEAIIDALSEIAETRRWLEIARHNRAVGLERFSFERHGAAMIAALEAALR